jgi:hypothetical protein
MPYAREADLYPEVVEWLKLFLTERFRRQKVVVRDTSGRPLKRFLLDEGLAPANKPEWQTFDVRVDVAGLIVDDHSVEFALIECKTTPIALKDVSQLLGYSRVVLPVYACILSPLGVSSDVASLLKTYSRLDVLEYNWPKGELPHSIVVATWNEQRKGIDYDSLIHAGHPLHQR